MENFFNYVSKPVSPEDVDLWFRVNNIYPEKMELFFDFVKSLTKIISETYLGDEQSFNIETKINLSDSDKEKHFDWCWNKTIDNFEKESLIFEKYGEHHEYFKSFYFQVFYHQMDKNVRDSIEKFFNELFNSEKPYTKSDLDMIYDIYKSLDKSLSVKKKSH